MKKAERSRGGSDTSPLPVTPAVDNRTDSNNNSISSSDVIRTKGAPPTTRTLLANTYALCYCLSILLLASVTRTVAESSSQHSEVRESKLEDVWRPLPSFRQIRPVYRPDPPLSREIKNHENVQEVAAVASSITNLAELNKALKSNVRISSAAGIISGRAGPTTVVPIGESLQMVTKQLLQSPSATDMVITDVRTPPKIKSQITKVSDEFDIFGKGEAIPITLEDHDVYEILPDNHNNTAIKNPSTTTPTTVNGISTWILLSNSDSTTPTTNQRKSQSPTIALPTVQSNPTNSNNSLNNKKKPIKTTAEANNSTSMNSGDTIKANLVELVKPERKQSVAITSNKQNTSAAVKKVPTTTNTEEIRIPVTINLQDSKFKNRQPIIMGRVPTTSVTSTSVKNITEVSSNNNKKKVTSSPQPQPSSEIKIESNTIAAIVPTRRRPNPQTTADTNTLKEQNTTATNTPFNALHIQTTSATPISTRRVPVYAAVVPTTSVIIETESADPDEPEEITTEDNASTTKRPRRPTNKKKKKPANGTNKRRRRPANKDTEDSPVLESKITEEANSTKTATSVLPSTQSGNRPLSTRIYNYLAREVMPSVGVGVVGLLLTAGLAGLFLYPFGGGVAARRTSFESTKNSLPSPDGHMYYYNEYSSKNDVDNAQAEESVFGQMLSGMTQAESQYESKPNSYSANKNNNNNNNHNMGSSNSNIGNSGDNNNNNNKKYTKYDGTSSLHGSSSNTASIVYPSSTKDSQKFTPVVGSDDRTLSNSQTGGNRMDTIASYSTLTDLSSGGGSHNDRNYPSLTTDSVNDNQYSSSQYSSGTVSGSSDQQSYSSSSVSTNKNGGSMQYGNMGSSSGSPQYSGLIGSTSLTSQSSNSAPSYSSLIGSSSSSNNQNSSPQYSSLISNGPTNNGQNSNVNPSYSSLINNPSVTLAGSNGSPQYQNLVSGNPTSNQQSPTGGSQFSGLMGSSSSNGQYSSSLLIDNSDTSHYSKTANGVSSSASNNGHRYSTHLTGMNEHDSGSQYSTLTGLSSDGNDNPSKYPSLTTVQQNKYQSSGEYAAYSNPSEIGTQGRIGYGSASSQSMTIDRIGDNHRSEQDRDVALSSASSPTSSSSSSSSSANNWKEIEFGVGDKDMIIKEEDKSDKSQPQFAALHSPQYMSLPPSRTDQTSFPSNVDMISITGGSNFNPSSSSASSSGSITSLTAGERLRQSPLTSIEHGPRYLKFTQGSRKKRQAETIPPSSSSSPSLNEIDGDLPKDDPNELYNTNKKRVSNLKTENLIKQEPSDVSSRPQETEPTETTTDTMSTTIIDTTTIDSNENSTDNSSSSSSSEVESSNESLKDDLNVTSTKPPQHSNEDTTFLGLVRRLAHFKLKLGLSFLRSTSQVVSKYFQSVQQRMEKVVRRLEKRARSYERQRNHSKDGNMDSTQMRSKRDTKYVERKLKYRKSQHNKKKLM